MPRIIWKGAISFGLVHIPVALHSASREGGIDFDWIDKRTLDPVGYKRINKRTGKEIRSQDIVRGIKQEGSEYVILGDDEIKAAYPRTTQTIEIEAFVQGQELPFYLLDRPYSLAPVGRGDKVYVLLREAMREAGVIGIARVVMHSKEHLAALVPAGPALMLNTLRWPQEFLGVDDLTLPAEGRGPLKAPELKMARQLIGEMTKAWKPEEYANTFAAAIHRLVKDKIKAGETTDVRPLEDAPQPTSGGSRSNVVDLTQLLAQSLRRKPAREDDTPSARVAPKKPAAKAARKPAAKKTAASRPRAVPVRKRA